MLTTDGYIRTDRLLNESCAPGYRTYTLIVEIDRGTQKERCELEFSKEDALRIATRILEINDLAWCRDKPIDAEPSERKPDWIVPHGTREPLRIIHEGGRHATAK